jgi:uncharacterized membrane protein YfcA
LTLVVPPVAADATSAVGLVLAYPTAVWRTRREIAALPRRWLWLLVPSVLGGLVGALLLVYTNDRNFTFLVPWLILAGTALFVLEPRLASKRNATPSSRGLPTKLLPLAVAITLAVAVYGGYFGADIGILMISALSLFGAGDVNRVVPLKNLLTGSLRSVAVVVLIVEGAINWGYGVPMVLGGLLGGHVGGMVSGRTDRRILRGLVIVIGFGVAAYYFWNVYGTSVSHLGGE